VTGALALIFAPFFVAASAANAVIKATVAKMKDMTVLVIGIALSGEEEQSFSCPLHNCTVV
jgi:hypothetical protein